MIQQLRRYLFHPFIPLIFGLLMCIGGVTYHLFALKRLEQGCDHFKMELEQKRFSLKRKEEESRVLKAMKEAEPNFVENRLEKLPLLASEVRRIQTLLHSEPQNSEYKRELEALEAPKNSLRFQERNMVRKETYKESDLIQKEAVLMNREDLTQLLTLLENPNLSSLHPPLFLIKTFTLIKTDLSKEEEVFKVQMELIKREMIQ